MHAKPTDGTPSAVIVNESSLSVAAVLRLQARRTAQATNVLSPGLPQNMAHATDWSPARRRPRGIRLWVTNRGCKVGESDRWKGIEKESVIRKMT